MQQKRKSRGWQFLIDLSESIHNLKDIFPRISPSVSLSTITGNKHERVLISNDISINRSWLIWFVSHCNKKGHLSFSLWFIMKYLMKCFLSFEIVCKVPIYRFQYPTCSWGVWNKTPHGEFNSNPLGLLHHIMWHSWGFVCGFLFLLHVTSPVYNIGPTSSISKWSWWLSFDIRGQCHGLGQKTN